MINEDELIFLTFVEENYSRSGVLRAAMPKSHFELLPSPSFHLLMKLVKFRVTGLWRDKVLVVMSPAHVLVLFLKLLFPNKIVLDAGWPLVDGAMSRDNLIKFNFSRKHIWHFILDFLCFKLAHVVALETNCQLERVKKLFKLNHVKVFRSFTGFDEIGIDKKKNDIDCPIKSACPECGLNDNKVILFRGKYNFEAGIEILAAATQDIRLQGVTFVIASNRSLDGIKFSEGTIVLSQFLSMEQIAHLYRVSDLSIGQISNNPRIAFTIPHKAYESAFFKTPYLTRDSVAIRELFPNDSDAIFFDPEKCDINDLIHSSINDKTISIKGENAFTNYSNVASQAVIATNFLNSVNESLELIDRRAD